MVIKTKTFRINEDAVNRYNDIFNSENLFAKKLHKEVFVMLLDDYKIEHKETNIDVSPALQNESDLESVNPTKDNPIKYSSNTNLEKNINLNVNEALKNQIQKLLEKNTKKFKSKKGVCRYLAGKILQHSATSDEIEKLGDKIYQASINRSNLSVANLIELEMKTEINLSDELQLSPFAALKSLQEIFYILEAKGIPTNQLTMYINSLSHALKETMKTKGDFIKLLGGLAKHLPS